MSVGHVPLSTAIEYIDPNDTMSGRHRARLLGVDPKSYRGWLADGTLSEAAADHVACHLGVHASVIWEEWETCRPVQMPMDGDDYSDLVPAADRAPAPVATCGAETPAPDPQWEALSLPL